MRQIKHIASFFSQIFQKASVAAKNSSGKRGQEAGGHPAESAIEKSGASRGGGAAEAPRKQQRGMTLIEILIVVGIITSVLGFVMNRVIKRGKKAKVSQAKIMLSALSQTVDEFSLDCGFYPETLKDLIEAPSSSADCEEWDGPYVKGDKFLKDPWKNEIYYEYDSNRNEYELISFGADRRAGGTGLNQDISSKDL